jgi:hypothetical protein
MEPKNIPCPYCNEVVTAYPPDDQHPNFSVEENIEHSGSVITRTYDCKNEKCGKPFDVLWFMPKRYFERA